MQSLSRRAKWAAPAGAVAAVAGVTAGSLISVAQAAPSLPARTPAQLLAEVAGALTPPPPLTGTVVETSSLGIPQLPGITDPGSLTSLLAGNHTVRVWYAGPRQFRLQAPVSLGETDLIRNGSTAWLWQSRGDSVTRYQLPAPAHHTTPSLPLTPQQAARQVLAAAGPTTVVRVESNVYVAGQPAYQLVLAPKAHQSLIGRVTIALDGAHPQVPLRVQVFARGAVRSAFQVSYTALSFVRPASRNFSFTPPPGASVHKVTQPGTVPSSNLPSSSLPSSGWTGYAPLRGQMAPGATPDGGAAPQVIGTGWLSILALPASALTGLTSLGGGGAAAPGGSAGPGAIAGLAGQSARSVAGQGGGVPPAGAIGAALLGSGARVHGAWGRGRLVRTSLVSILVTSTGRVLIGAVTPPVLYAAALRVK